MKRSNWERRNCLRWMELSRRALALLLTLSMSLSYMAPLASAAEQTNCGKEAHGHTEGCYEQKLVCTEPTVNDHVHGEGCYEAKSTLSCQIPEKGHAHSESCRGQVRTLTCGVQESADHAHTDACYTMQEGIVCGQTETADHTHGDACYTVQQVKTCTRKTAEDETHVHTDSCYGSSLICTLEVHQHTDDCYAQTETQPQETTATGSTDASEATEATAAATSSTTEPAVTEDTTAPTESTEEVPSTGPELDPDDEGEPIQIWIDPTNGGNEFYKGVSVDYRELTPDEEGNVMLTLPTDEEIGRPSGYAYKVNAWYDIATAQKYVPGKEYPVDKNMVFYADWVPASYDIGKPAEVTSADTSGFVTVTMYDFNDIANLGSGAVRLVESRADGYGQEKWETVEDAAYLPVHTWRGEPGSLEFPNMPEDGAYRGNSSNIKSGLSARLLPYYFNGSNIGVSRVGTADGLFRYDEARGYYMFNSHVNGATYYQNGGNGYFRLYDAPSKSSCIGRTEGSRGDFLPYNAEYGEGIVVDHDGNGNGENESKPDANYWYGMTVEIDFSLPGVPGGDGKTLNRSVNNNPMVFFFSGDDDVYVYLSDGKTEKMVLDMGGIHEGVSGFINFANGRYCTLDADGGTEVDAQTLAEVERAITGNEAIVDGAHINTIGYLQELFPGMKKGDYTLKMYYMERGGGLANCSVYFNLAPRKQLTIHKEDPAKSDANMMHTEFTVYEEILPGDTAEGELEILKNGETVGLKRTKDLYSDKAGSVFTIGEKNLVDIFGFYPGKTYYIKETRAPAGYADYLPNRLIRIQFTPNGDLLMEALPQQTLVGLGGQKYAYASVKPNNDPDHGELIVRNTEPDDKLHLRKYWYDHEKNHDAQKQEAVTVDVYRYTIPDAKLDDVIRNAELFKAGHAFTTSDDLALTPGKDTYTSDGKAYYYYFVERPVTSKYAYTDKNGKDQEADYQPPMYFANGVLPGGTLEVANSPEAFNSAMIKVTKRWYYKDGTLMPSDAVAKQDAVSGVLHESITYAEETVPEEELFEVSFQASGWGENLDTGSEPASVKDLPAGTKVTVKLVHEKAATWAGNPEFEYKDAAGTVVGVPYTVELKLHPDCDENTPDWEKLYNRYYTLTVEVQSDDVNITGNLNSKGSEWKAGNPRTGEPLLAYVLPEAPEGSEKPAKPENTTNRMPFTLSPGNGWAYVYDDAKVSGKEEIDGVIYDVVYSYRVEETDGAQFDAQYNNNNVTFEMKESGAVQIETVTIANTSPELPPAYVDISVAKKWDDADNRDGKRPESITVKLLADGADAGKSITLNEANQWAGKFEDLDKQKDGKDIVYTVEEVSVTGYTTDVAGSAAKGFVITNTYVPEQTEVSVRKVWEDADNQDGLRPASITVNLLADGKSTGKSLTLNEANQWSGKFEKLDKHKSGREITYTIEEVSVTGYTADITGNAVNGYIITNTHTPETIRIPVEKVWKDAENQDGKRPGTIEVKLLADGKETGRVLVLSAANDWKASFTDLDKFAGGREIAYTVQETPVTGYTTDMSGDAEIGYTITNRYVPEKTQFVVTKTWNDGDDQDGKRPGSIVVDLLADAEVVASAELKAETGWTYTFTGLDVYKNGREILYTVEERSVPEGYAAKVDGHTITNTHTPETIRIPVEKIWKDAENQDGKRPESITVRLLADNKEVAVQELTAETGWKHTFENLPKYAGGRQITYAVQEDSIENYTTEVNGFTITNTHTPETTQLAVLKNWEDAENQDGKRPYAVVVALRVDNVTTEETLILSEANGWTGKWTGLAKYRNGEEINYAVEEIGYYATAKDVTDPAKAVDTLPEGYLVTHHKAVIDGVPGIKVTNSYRPDETALNVKKVWDDDDNRDSLRPDAITVTLQKKVAGAWQDVLDEKNQPVTRTLTAAGKWEADFFGLPKYDDGQEIAYGVVEKDVPAGYTVSYSEISSSMVITITNTHEPEQIQIPVTKIWKDARNQDGKRPASITVNLLANGSLIGSAVLNNTNAWTYTFAKLPKYAGGQPISYTVEEVAVEGYTAAITGNAVNGYVITNTHTPETIRIPVEKVWKDAEDQDGKRPESITVRLLADNKEVAVQELTAETGWKHTFENLPKYAGGRQITYAVQEDSIENYTTEVNGFTITNTHTPETTQLAVLKNWEDAENQDGKRPYAVVVALRVDNVTTEETLILSEANGWTGKWTGLAKYRNGEEINYAVEEIGYYATAKDVTDPAKAVDTLPEGYLVTHHKAVIDGVPGIKVTNSYRPDETALNVKKVWDDDDNRDSLRPDAITVTLQKKVAGAWQDVLDEKNQPVTRTLTAAGKWEADFFGLPKYDDGQEIAYGVVEKDVPAGYTVSYSEISSSMVITITNTHEPEQIQIPVTKIWEDDGNKDGMRPESITVNLLTDGKKVASAELNEDNGWSWTFENLPKNAGGKAIAYTVEENAVDNYAAEISGNAVDGYTIRNRQLKLSVVKWWFDADGNQIADASAMDAVEFTLYRKAKYTPVADAPAKADETTTVYAGTLCEENGWRYDCSSGLKSRERIAIGNSSYDVAYSYFVRETRIPSGYALIRIDNNNLELAATENSVIAICNQPIPRETTSLTITKVDKADAERKLSGARFTLYKWNGKWEQVSVLTSDAKGRIVFDGLAYNTAYKLEENKAPVGYEKDGGPWYFFYAKEDTDLYPVARPEGDASYTRNVSEANTIQIANPQIPEDTSLELTVKKTWYAKNATKAGKAPSKISKITFDLHRKAVTADGKTVKLKKSLVDSYTITKQDGWSITISDLSAEGYETVNGVLTEVEYTYYVEEDPVDGYKVSYKGQNTTTIEIRNTENPKDLSNPKTGDTSHIGLYLLTMLLSSTALVFTATRKRRRV